MPEPVGSPPLDHVAVVEAESVRVSALLRTGPLDAPVVSCPGWDVAALAGHLGWVQRWARLAVVTGGPPDNDAIGAPSPDLAAWIDEGAAALVSALRGVDPDAPAWHPFSGPRVGRFWPRRQAHEVTVHRWDIEQALGRETAIPPAVAADGIAEYVEVIAPRIARRERSELPKVDLRIACPDAGWTGYVDAQSGPPRLVDRLDGPHATVEAPAEDVLLALWGRRPLAASAATPNAAAWLCLGGS